MALPFAVDPAADLRFMPIFSGPRSVPLAAADILIVWAALVGRVVAVRPHRRWVALAHRWTR